MKTLLSNTILIPALLAASLISLNSAHADQASAERDMNAFQYQSDQGAGMFRKAGNTWTETTPANTTFTFRELQRGNDHVWIYDDARQATLKLTRTQAQAHFPGWDKLYPIYNGKFVDAAPVVVPIDVPGGENDNPPVVNNNQKTIQQLILEKVNAYRVSEGRAALTLNNTIQNLSQQHSQEMANRYNGQLKLDHNGFGERATAIRQADTTVNGVAENVFGGGSGGTNEQIAQAAFNGWKNSPGHNQNMLAPNSTTTGLGVVKRGNVVYITQMFAESRQ